MEIQFNYSAIRTDQFAVFNHPINSLAQGVSLTGEVQTGNNYQARSIMITVSSNIKYENDLLLTIKVSSYFEIAESSWDAMKDGGMVVIPKEFLWHIGGLAVSTTRGILFAKTEGTDLNRFILPVIYMNEIITGEMKIPVPEVE